MDVRPAATYTKRMSARRLFKVAELRRPMHVIAAIRSFDARPFLAVGEKPVAFRRSDPR